jgi:hypothetical protein
LFGQSCDHVEDRRLAAAGLAQDCQHLAGTNIEVDVVDGAVRRVAAGFAKDLADPIEVNRRVVRCDDIPHIARSDTAR